MTSFSVFSEVPLPLCGSPRRRGSTNGRSARSNKIRRRPKQSSRPRAFHAYLPAWEPDTEDSYKLAADPNFFLPSDNSRRKPRLQRQDAFREPKAWDYFDFVEDDADLYKLGLLYDDPHVLSSDFNLDTIDHPDPVYTTRPAKRAKKHRETFHLQFDHLVTSVVSDGAFQSPLTPETVEISIPTEDEFIDEQRGKDKVSRRRSSRRSYRHMILSAIPELSEKPAPSSDKPAPAPAATDCPDLASDSEEGCEDDKEDDFTDDWAMLEADDVNGPGTVVAVSIDASENTGEAWIVLGDGS